MHERLPIMELVQGQALDFPTPKNLNYWWTFGGILAVMLVVQIVTGIVLVMHYTPHVDMAFASVEHIMRDVNSGWLIRYMHANGASMFFIAVYIHMFRGMYYGSYKAPREVLWMIGVLIYLVMMATAFMGYVLPWGQMTLLGRQGHHQPVLGHSLRRRLDHHAAVGRLLGRQPDAQPLLLAALPAALRARRPRRPAHLGAARAGQQQPDRRLGEEQPGHAALPPLLHDEGCLRDRRVLHVLRRSGSSSRPTTSATPINYQEANPLVTPAHIVPEWYFLPFYAILRAIPDKLGGVIAMFGSILILFVLPWLDTSKVRSGDYRPIFKRLLLDLRDRLRGAGLPRARSRRKASMWCSRASCTVYYFAHFLVILPLLGLLESPKPLPASISDDVLAKKRPATAAVPAE